MKKSFGSRSDRGMSVVNQSERLVDFVDATTPDRSVFQKFEVPGPDLLPRLPACVRLDLELLKCFEVVDRQFQQAGVTFANAIALRPSNPAYPSYSGTTVLMGSPKSGWVEATFSSPVRFVSGLVTSSRRTVMAAFDANNRPLGQVVTDGANLAGSDSRIAPNVELSLRADEIHRVTFYAFDGHLTIGDFSFGG
ncbi:hypothetical protein IQ268_14970 [Oculatella sp. LEGE 06141]|uniref:hypothetical protein n=1 Tax=Oculatella sp. LEGE 06141 TaxID=1828648 RepID=UPI0018822FE9|nr:hypothetical protein [Oculatella sp. LEGE 06141]MBE9179871.1 hypothetical protein [Oculatella sp. LEGE 06141]